MATYGTIVVGAGVMGSATAYHLARSGERVLLVERFELGHGRGSSHGHSRIIRYAYDHPAYVRLAGHAYRLWEELGREAGERVIFPSGGLDLARAGHPVLDQISSSLSESGIGFQALERADLARRFPQFHPPPGWAALYQADAGIIPASRAVELLVSRARFHGAEVRERSPVTGIEVRDGGVEVQTASGRVAGGSLVITAGSWSAPLLARLGLELPLRPRRQQVHFFRPGSLPDFRPGQLPVFIAWGHPLEGSGGDAGSEPPAEAATFYGLPVFGLEGVKVAEHCGGSWIDPEDEDAVDPAQTARVSAFVRRFLPGAAGRVIHAETCRYTMTPDEHFVIDRHPELDNVLIAGGFSGHGFKFGVLVGLILSRMARGRRVEHDLSLFRLERLRPA